MDRQTLDLGAAVQFDTGPRGEAERFGKMPRAFRRDEAVIALAQIADKFKVVAWCSFPFSVGFAFSMHTGHSVSSIKAVSSARGNLCPHTEYPMLVSCSIPAPEGAGGALTW